MVAATVFATGASAQPQPDSGAMRPSSELMSKQELLACIGHEERIRSARASLAARALPLKAERDELAAEAAKIGAETRAIRSANPTEQEGFVRRVDALNRRSEAAMRAAAAFNEEGTRIDAEVRNFNAACTTRPFHAQDREAALAEYRAASAAASSATNAQPATAPGPFEAGVAAYDRGQFEVAYALWLPLADQGRVAAQFNVAALLENGQGVPRNETEAARWYLKAAEQGDPEAQLKAGWLYEQGRGVPLDLAKAKFWYAKLLDNGRAATAAPESLRFARERLAGVSRVEAPEDVFAYDGGRFVVRNAESGECVVALQGAVNRNASAAFDKVLAETERRRCTRPATLLLESPGGIVSDGLWLGARVRRGGFRTIARYQCASSCAIIFLGGVERWLMGARAAIGFHQAAWQRDLVRECERPDSRVSLEIRDYFRQVIPATADQVFQLAMDTSCNSIDWVRGQRAIDLGVATAVHSAGVDIFGPKASREQKP